MALPQYLPNQADLLAPVVWVFGPESFLQSGSMTRLASITNNHLALECGLCGHNSQLAVIDLIQRLGRECSVSITNLVQIA